MATMPIQSLTSAWSLLVNAGDEFTMTLRDNPVRVVAQDTATAPLSLDIGHTLMAQPREAWNRALAGPGYLYARAVGSSATAEVTTWTP